MTLVEDTLVLAEAAAGPPALVEAEEDSRPARPSRLARVGRAAAGVGWGLLGFAVITALWQLASMRVAELPSPADAAATLRELLSTPLHDNGPNDKGVGLMMLGSLQRVFIGFALAAVVGVPIGLLMGVADRVHRMLNPLVQLLRPVSPLAWFPLLLVVLKDAPRAAIWVIFVTSLWPIVLNTAAGAAAVPRDQRNVARVFRFGRWTYFRHVLVPHTLPSIVTGLRLSMGVAWMVIVAGEMLSGGTGIGSFVWTSYNALDLSRVVAAILLIGIVGVVLDAVFLRLARRFVIEEVQP